MQVEDLVSLSGAVIAIVMAVAAWRKARPEARERDGAASLAYAQAGEMAAKRIIELQTELSVVREELNLLKIEFMKEKAAALVREAQFEARLVRETNIGWKLYYKLRAMGEMPDVQPGCAEPPKE